MIGIIDFINNYVEKNYGKPKEKVEKNYEKSKEKLSEPELEMYQIPQNIDIWKMKDIEKVKKDSKNIDKNYVKNILEEAKNEISQKGFSVIEINNQKRLEFFYNIIELVEIKYYENRKNFKKRKIIFNIYFSIFFLFVAIFSFIYQEFFLILVILTLFFIVFSIISEIKYEFLWLKTRKNIIKDNDLFFRLWGVLSKYWIITNKYIFIDRKIYVIENNKITKFIFMENSETYKLKNSINLEDLIFENKDYSFIDKFNQGKIIYKKYQTLNKKEEKLIILKNSLNEIEVKIEKLLFLKNFIKNNISNLKNWDFLDKNFFKKIDEFNKFVSEIVILKEKSENQLKILEIKKYIDFEEFEIYIKNSIIFPLKSLKEILKIQLNYCNISISKNKNSQNSQIILLNKRLIIQKENLEKQIFLLDEKIKKLEN